MSIKLDDLTRDQKRLLVYLETRCVDYAGLVDTSRMNANEASIAEAWNESGFIQYGRVAASSLTGPDPSTECPCWCFLTEDAWRLAHEERRIRADRMLKQSNVERRGFVPPSGQQEQTSTPLTKAKKPMRAGRKPRLGK